MKTDQTRNVATNEMNFRVEGDKIEKITLFCYLEDGSIPSVAYRRISRLQ